MAIDEGFSLDEQIINGISKGYVSSLDVKPMSVVKEACHNTINFDFLKGNTKRRNPYDILLNLLTVLPLGYSIDNFHEKVFIDKDGNNKTCYIVVATKAGSRSRVYISKYFNPSSIYDNNHAASEGWEETWTELTEYFTGTIESLDNGTAPECEFEITNATINQTADYYRGFYVYQILNSSDTVDSAITDNTAIRCIGMVSDYSYSGGKGRFDVIRRSYPASDTVYPNREIPEINDDDVFYIVRFPVVINNLERWNDVTDVDFEDTYNAVVIAAGYDSRPIWIGFISERVAFQGGFYISDFDFTGVGLDDMSYMGTYQGQDDRDFIIEVETGGGGPTPNRWRWKRAGDVSWIGSLSMILATTWVYLQDGISIKFAAMVGHTTADLWTIEVSGSDDGIRRWNGFYMDFESPQIDNKKTYTFAPALADGHYYRNITELDIGRELGIDIYLDLNAGATAEPKDRFFSFCTTFDGFQTFFIKNLELKPMVPAQVRIVYIQDVYVNFNIDFNRRITATNLFYSESDGEFDENVRYDNVIPDTQWVDIERGGDVPLYGESIISNIFDSNFNVNRFAPMYHENGQHNQSDGSYILNYATGEVLNAFLNHRYYNDIKIKCKKFIQVQQNILGIDLSPDNIGSDNKTEQSHGASKVAFPCIQRQGTVHSNCVYDSERVKTMAKEDLTGAIATTGLNFLLFTKYITKWYEITDEKNLVYFNRGNYSQIGAVSRKGIVSAVYEEKTEVGTSSREFGGAQFGGVFFNDYNSIWGFFDNQPIDLLYGRWKEEYKAIANSGKEQAIAGFRPSYKDVYFYFPTTGKLFLFNILEKHWKKYDFSQYINNPVQTAGTGLNDITVRGAYTSTIAGTFSVKISTAASPDKFQYRKDGGSWSAEISITGANQSIGEGIEIKFTATTGHTLNDEWDIKTQNPKNLKAGKSGEILFHSDRVIFSMEADGTAKYQDCTNTPITFLITQNINHQTSEIKVADGFELFYDIDTIVLFGETTAGNVYINVGCNGSLTNIINNKLLTLQGKSKFKITFGTRIPCSYYTVTLSYDSATINNIESFNIYIVKYLALLTEGTINKN